MALNQSACTHHHTLVPVVNDLYVCECPSVYRKVGKAFVDAARKGQLEAILELMGGPTGIAHRAKHLEYLDAQRRSDSRPGAISGHYGDTLRDQ